MQRSRIITCLVPGLVGLAGASASAVEPHAGSTPVVVPTPRQLAPPGVPAWPTELLPAAPTVPRELGKPDDDLVVNVGAYTVSDSAPAALKEALPRLTAAFVGQGRRFEDLANAANEVTRFLQRDLGYYLGYAYIPEQALDADVIRIAVLEGRLDHVELNWQDDLPVRREVVQACLDRLQPGAILTVEDVERAVFLVNDLRGITVKAEVKAGRLPGTAILEFTPTADARLSGSVDTDMNGSRFIGAERLGGLVSLTSPFGRGDGVSLSALASVSGGLHFALLGYTTPLGSDGFKSGLSVSGLRYRLDPAAFPLGLSGTGTTVNAFGLYPWVRSRNLNLFALAAVDAKSYVDNVASLSTRKRVNDINLGLNGDFRDSLLSGAVNTFDLSLSAGRLSYANGTPSGLDDAPSYSKLNAAYSRLQNVVDGRLLVYLSARAQWAMKNLDTTEQFRAGGNDGVRAFAPGEGTGDSGLVMSTELRWLPPESWLGRWSREIVFAGFYDMAAVRFRHDATLVVRGTGYVNHTRLSGAGLSMVWARPGAYSMRLSVAKPTQGQPTNDTQMRSARVYAQASWLF